jgi:hypothetical protein
LVLGADLKDFASFLSTKDIGVSFGIL